jgi:hypothetical protein
MSILRVGQALADVATIGLLHQRAIRRRDTRTEQPQTARLEVAPDQAVGLLRQGARSHNRRLSDLAHAMAVGATPGPVSYTDGVAAMGDRWIVA